jgi:hypothetical protein
MVRLEVPKQSNKVLVISDGLFEESFTLVEALDLFLGFV